jgi:flagellar capping protein FliD
MRQETLPLEAEPVCSPSKPTRTSNHTGVYECIDYGTLMFHSYFSTIREKSQSKRDPMALLPHSNVVRAENRAISVNSLDIKRCSTTVSDYIEDHPSLTISVITCVGIILK